MVPFSMLCSPQINLKESPWLLRGIINYLQSILHRRYQEMINEYPHLKCIISEPPILSFRRNRNLRNWLVIHALQNLPQTLISLLVTVLHVHPNEANASNSALAMSNSSSITNKLTSKSCFTFGGKCNTTDTIYAAECTKHNLIYVGHSSQKLSGRFNSHRSDVKVKSKACKLS